MLKLNWLAERVRKTKRIQEQLANGEYHIDTNRVAKAMLNLDIA
jgi:anti-sigma28 factor (negative regulator of flagellin synthesis)